MAKRPTYLCLWIRVIVNWNLRSESLTKSNHKRGYRITEYKTCFFQNPYQPDQNYDSKVVVERSNLRRCSDGLQFVCWNDDDIGLPFLVDENHRKINSLRFVAKARVSGFNLQDKFLEAVEIEICAH